MRWRKKDRMVDAYVQHKHNADLRGIPFLLSYWEWGTIWIESGRWEQRGSRRGQYVMARLGDQGAYELGNVVICLAEENRAERNRKYTISGERHHNYNPLLHEPSLRESPEAFKVRVRLMRRSEAAVRSRDVRGCFLPKEAVQ